jgi:hypothetical protein
MYPHTSLEKWYIRDGGKIHGYDSHDIGRMFSLYNKIKWVQKHGSDIIKNNTESESSLARMVQNAYNAGEQQDLIQESKSRKMQFEKKLDALENMKPEFRERWFEEEPDLKKAWDTRQESKKGGGQ